MTSITLTFMEAVPNELIDYMVNKKPIGKKRLLKLLPNRGVYLTMLSQDHNTNGYRFIKIDDDNISYTQMPNQL